MRKIKVVVLLVQQLQHGFTKNAKASPNLTFAHVRIVIKKGKGGPIAYWPLGRRTVRGSPCLGHSIWKAEPIPLLPLPFLP